MGTNPIAVYKNLGISSFPAYFPFECYNLDLIAEKPEKPEIIFGHDKINRFTYAWAKRGKKWVDIISEGQKVRDVPNADASGYTMKALLETAAAKGKRTVVVVNDFASFIKLYALSDFTFELKEKG